MENLKDIIKEIQDYKKILSMQNLTDDNILDCSVRIFISQNIANGKKSNGNLEPATSKQLSLLNSLGIRHSDNISKRDAVYLIKEKVKRR